MMLERISCLENIKKAENVYKEILGYKVVSDCPFCLKLINIMTY